MKMIDILKTELEGSSCKDITTAPVSSKKGAELTYYGCIMPYDDKFSQVFFREFPNDAVLICEETKDDIDVHLHALLWYTHAMQGYIPKPLPPCDGYTSPVRVDGILSDIR